MTDNKISPFAESLLSSAPTQKKMQAAEKELKKVQSQQHKKQNKTDKDEVIQAQIAMVGKPFWWMVFMFICSVLYLFPEAVFNAALTDVAGGKSSTEEDLRAVELFGRTISGIGVTLLLADMLLKGKHVAKVGKAFGLFLLIGVLVWPTVFFGQKWLVDHFIVDTSSAEDRQQAYLSQIIRSALIERSVEFEGIKYDPDAEHTALEKAFLSIFGGLVYADDKVVSGLEKRKHRIMEKFVNDHAMSRFDEHYGNYNDFRSRLRSQYKEYAKASNDYNQELASSPRRADTYWLEVQNEIKDGWGQYQKGTSSYEARVESRAQKIAPKVYDYFERREKCDDKKKKYRAKCYAKYDAYYDKEIKKYQIPYIPANDWLIREEISSADNFGTSVIAGVLTGGLFTALQAASLATGGDGGMKDHRMVYTNDVKHYKSVLMVKMEADFVKESGGYPLGINSLDTFRMHDVTNKKVKISLRNKGLKLLNNWSLLQRAEFDTAVAVKVRQEADKKWNKGIKNSSIPPNLPWQKFQIQSDVQHKIKQQMGELYVKPMYADWNNVQFKKNVIDVNVQRKTAEYLKVLKAQRVEFEDGGAFESTGKSALRAIIVPPISMGISLLLVLLTVLKLPIKAIELVKVKRAVKGQETVKQKKRLNAAISFTLISSIFIVPVLLGNNEFTKPGSTVNYFFHQMEKNDSATVSFALKWLLITQPLVQPIGSAIDNTLSITKGFDNISGPISRFDLRLYNHEDESVGNENVSSVLLPLTVKTNVDSAKISIMNIKPKYNAGMLLPAGAYDVKVSANGYDPVRQWIYLKAENSSFKINL
ncbi:hypothetical protein CXF85_22040 [Colwellia sp. 75C3]|uniref:hypothetical protein n=1 Tax=Colwellia sp. 75C3 TaxID=888425 RepID=UPI000C344BFA|nr:hypothetical protein [Colwellia sp. 75C3]PKG80792.1 hypothetical protein CXF85_22040 [Colwellia sp. 75C3]